MKSRSSSYIKGIDISSHQGSVDFAAVKNTGIEVVYIKATEGLSYQNPFMLESYKGAKDNDLKIGFFHYFWPHDEENAKEQARYFINSIKDFEVDCRYAIDVEEQNNLDAATLSSLCIAFLEEVKALTGKEVIFYCNTDYAQHRLDSSVGCYPVWIAQYGDNQPSYNPIWSDWAGFQYTSKGTVPGINVNVDLDEFTDDIYIKSVWDVPPDFVEETYLELNPDVAEAITQALYGLKSGAQHYATMGKSEGRAYKKAKRCYVRTENFFGKSIEIMPILKCFNDCERLYAIPSTANTLYFESQWITKDQAESIVQALDKVSCIGHIIEEGVDK